MQELIKFENTAYENSIQRRYIANNLIIIKPTYKTVFSFTLVKQFL
jgi:hypothetical protein